MSEPMENGNGPSAMANGSGYHHDASSPTTSTEDESGRGRRKRKPKHAPDFEQPAEPKKKGKKKKIDPEEEFETVWICAECKEAECLMKPEADRLLICEGSCRRLFHYPCAGLDELPAEDEEYRCDDCQQQRHRCAICQDYGEDEVDVFLCSRPTCGLFFHEACLAMQNVEVHVAGENGDKANGNASDQMNGLSTGSDDGNEATRLRGKRQFVCPAHWCWTCTQTDLKEQEKEANSKERASSKAKKGKKGSRKTTSSFECKTERRMIRCIECPTSYHVTCIPPPARFHELAMLCHEHASSHKLPDLDTETSIQSSIEQKVDRKYGELNTRRQNARKTSGQNLFFPGLKGDKLTQREKAYDHLVAKEGGLEETVGFCLPCDLKNEVYSKPPSYTHIHSLRYDPSNRPPRVARADETCQCFERCGQDCLNRVLYTECTGDIKTGKTTNCRIGPDCGNRLIGQRLAKKCKPVREQGKGWGLITLDKVRKGELVQEYVGEVIDSKEKDRRLIGWSEEHPNDHNFYIMELQAGWLIDARQYANLSRFINHSCDPNCHLVPLNVAGSMRIGIFALKDIAAGDWLSYDYCFDTRQTERFVCRCGAKNCRGTMKGGAGQEDGLKKSAKEIWDEAKAKYERDKRFMAEHFAGHEMRRSQVAANNPGATGSELVANGVQQRYRTENARGRMFLWRNAERGSDFESRLARLEGRK